LADFVHAEAGIRIGRVYGASDHDTAYPAANATPPADLIATVNHCFGIPPDAPLADSEVAGRLLIW
jgi:hypothetical protein